ncbi:MAG: hypothetical protein AAGB05_06150 [Pseudomonadota bacterium]
MSRFSPLLGAVFAVGLAAAVPAQTTAGADAAPLPIFDTPQDMRAELDRLMRDRDFIALVSRFSPPALMSLGRVRVLEDRYKSALAPFEDSGHLILETPAEHITREVIAYWEGEVYVYVYLLTHQRNDGVRVLDFQVSGDIRAIKEWW